MNARQNYKMEAKSFSNQFFLLMYASPPGFCTKMVFYVGSMPPSCFLLGSEFPYPEMSNHRSLTYHSKYNISNKMVHLNPLSRSKLVMERHNLTLFLDLDQEAQSEVDLDLLPLWEEKQIRVKDQHISVQCSLFFIDS